MIIKSIRLKNIKSYGEGPTGTGVTISLENGVNRVAGRNGHGKTTLIESIGYALFLTEPQFEENFQIETYFLSHGAKEGEIDVTFSCEGESYRIERAVGKQTKRRAKVIQLSDGSICAEGESEVSAFLCRLLKFTQPEHLSEVFCKLVGVKQGRLAWPFDSKSAEAKHYFEPLLEVEVFRNCFDRLKEVVRTFENERGEQLEKQAGISERIRERADSPETLANAQQKVEADSILLEQANKARDEALKLKEQLESLGKATEDSRVTFNAATQKTVHAKSLREASEVLVTDSKAAGKVIAENEAAHTAHIKAVQALDQLELRRESRDGFKQRCDDAEAERTKHQFKATAARAQGKVFGGQRGAKQKEYDALVGKITPRKNDLEATAAIFKKSAQEAETAQGHRDTMGGWIEGLAGLAKSQKHNADRVLRLSKEISGWDSTKLEAAKKEERDAAGLLNSAHEKLAKAEQRHTILQEQLEEISGGICPFLKEKCRQFDPAKVQADLEKQFSTIAVVKREVEKTKAAYQKADLALNGLTVGHGNITGKKTELSGSIGLYLEGLESLTSDEAAEALKWLAIWERKLPLIPTAPKIPTKKLDAKAVASLQQQLENFVNEAEEWWDKADSRIKARLKTFNEAERTRKAQEIALGHDSEQLVQIKAEIKVLAQNITAKETEANQHDAAVGDLVKQVGKLNDALKPFTNLDADLKGEQKKRDSTRDGHERYIGAKKLADDLGARQTRLKQFQSEEAAAQLALQTAAAALRKAEQDFDSSKLEPARVDHRGKHDRAIALKVSLEADKEKLRKEERRFNEWEEACKERNRVSAEIGRCEAAKDLTELARKTLKDTAPAVAQHLCSRIATRAQRVFNQINPEPIALSWNAENYSLCVTPGDRRFAMLSGGEQTKLALAMTLAMIEEFSGLRFCIFDEPTYGVDADSRHKLADAILQAQETAGFDQLLLVSHDDAFEGKIEHAVLLEKSAALGTSVVLTQ